jgi:hypothetical protein
MELRGQSPWYLHEIPPTHLDAVGLRRATAKASEDYPPSAKSAEAAIFVKSMSTRPGSGLT